jgi:hypothetical protein
LSDKSYADKFSPLPPERGVPNSNLPNLDRIDKGYLDKWYLESTISGNLSETDYRYEKFTITLIGNLSPCGEGSGTMVLIIKRDLPGKVASTV